MLWGSCVSFGDCCVAASSKSIGSRALVDAAECLVGGFRCSIENSASQMQAG